LLLDSEAFQQATDPGELTVVDHEYARSGRHSPS
jgi:hypothetical protein